MRSSTDDDVLATRAASGPVSGRGRAAGGAGGEVGLLVEHLFRRSAGRIVATLTRALGPGRLDLAEEAVQDALLRALQAWPHQGVPRNPEGWLFRVAHNRALDLLRRASTAERHAEAERDGGAGAGPNGGLADSVVAFVDAADPFGDDELAMVFLCCHPRIPHESRVALTLKTVGGLSVDEIAAAFLAEKAAIAQRLVRAKRVLREGDVTFELPPASELPARLDAVLQVLYLLFNEGYAAHSGEALVRRELCGEAIRLAELLAAHETTSRPEVHALLALMLLQASRLPAREAPDGTLLLLEQQDRTLWDRSAIAAGMRHLDRAAGGDTLTVYHVGAGIASCHALAPRYEDTDWRQVLDLYDVLEALNPTPVVRLNRAVAVAMVHGPARGLEELYRLEGEPALRNYCLFPATIADLLLRTGERQEAALHYRRALGLARTPPERLFLEQRLRECRTAD